MGKSSLTLILFLTVFGNVFSLEKSEIFQSLTVDEGLAQNSVIVIEEDSYGFLWIGTQAGFTRWNGTTLINYPRKDIDAFPPGFVNLINSTFAVNIVR
ncbi:MULTISPECIES: two-component regulator propeller domain-containing protein [unclassified Oceanispirochaeta]|uniref:two-component regulator propeller domain-containing protein n=1 Tax=unclassified Oceanispirochaeta TaxID=2635722 RepID=UPI000E098F91|nr:MULTISPECIES: two-component regulator propeller domain-containing protein [unclassified Oceanispirochaeta]MBF9016612.1 hypothetical protein [Oceanispirochaeta sp. M2]NPD73183.1 hypothetical protein [Oceanispirochaeta sp. M1]RDG31280.1 hypothetical protein DV872_13860 [Oceanispirochaeta sp. M1]